MIKNLLSANLENQKVLELSTIFLQPVYGFIDRTTRPER